MSVATMHVLPFPPPLEFILHLLSGGFVQEEPVSGVCWQVGKPPYGLPESVHGQKRSVRSLSWYCHVPVPVPVAPVQDSVYVVDVVGFTVLVPDVAPSVSNCALEQ